MIACIINFSSEPRPDHQIGLPREGVWKEILNTDAEVYDGTGLIGNLGQVIAHPVPSHGYVASASVTIPPLAAVWLRLEPELDEEQEIEPERVTRGVIAAARAASPNATRTDNALTGPAQPRRAKPAETAAAEAGEEDQADRAATPVTRRSLARALPRQNRPPSRRNRQTIRIRPIRRTVPRSASPSHPEPSRAGNPPE